MEPSPSQGLASSCLRYSLFALRSQLSLSFVWFDAGEQRLAIVPDRWATFAPGLAAFGGGSSQAVERLKHFPVAGLTMPAWPKLAAKDAFAFKLAGSAFATPLSTIAMAPFPVAGTRKSGGPGELVFMSPEIVALVPQDELAGARVFILDPGKDVIGQVSSALQAHPGAAVVRVISHGEPGSLMLAGQRLTRDTLQLRADEIAGWRQQLAPGADILLYGCSVAGTSEGRRFVDVMAALTVADVAASVNRTGAAPLGGDLVLEYATGPIEARTGRFAQAWDQSGLILAAPVFSSAPTATFTTGVSGSFTAAASGSPTYALAQQTLFASDFTARPSDWTLSNSAQISGGACVLNPATASTNGALILPKLGADSPGSFTATFDYTAANVTVAGTAASGTSFNYGVLSTTTGSATSMVGSTGLSIAFLEAYIKAGPVTVPSSVEVRWNGTVIASAPVTFGTGAKPLQIKLDDANFLTVSYDGTQVLRVNLAGKVNAADRSNWQFALGVANSAANPSSHTIDTLAIVANGTLPAGLALDATTGVISGTPTTANAAGTQVFSLVATNADGATRQRFALTVASGAPVYSSAVSAPLLPGVPFAHTVVAPGPAGATTYSAAPQTLLSTTLANTGTLPAGAAINGSARFNAGALELTQAVASQTGSVQFQGQGTQNPTAFSASFAYKVGGGSTLGGNGISFNYGAPGDTSKGLRVSITELPTNATTNANLQVTVWLNGTTKVGETTIVNPFTGALYTSNTFLPVRLAMSAEGRVQVWVNNVLAYDTGAASGWQTTDKSLWAFSFTGTTGTANTNFHTIKDLVIGTNGVLPPGLALDSATGVITGKLGLGTAVDHYVNVTATNPAGTAMQLLKLDVSPSFTLPGQRPATGTSLGGANSLGVTGEQFRNLSAFAALTSDGSVKVWGNPANGGAQTSAPTGTGYTALTSNEKAFAALKNDGSIFSWGFSANGATGEPTGTGYQQISATRSAFAAIKNDGSIVAWGDTANGGAFNAASTSSPTGTGYARIFANGGGFVAQKFDGTIRAWGNTNSIGSAGPSPTLAFSPRVTVNDFGSGTVTYGSFAGLQNTGGIKAWGSSTTGGITGAPSATGQQDIVATSRAFAAIDSNGNIKAWGDSLFGGGTTSAGVDYLKPPTDSGYKQIYGNNAAFVAVRQDGSLSAWGSSLNGGSGAPTGTGYVQVFSTLNNFAALKADGSLSVWGSTLDGLITRAPSGTGYVSLFSSNSAFAALKADGSVTVWGNTLEGGTNGPSGTGWTEITSSGTAFAARKNDGTLFAWGSSTTGGTGAPAGSFLTVQSPTLAKPYLPVTAGAPVNLIVQQTQETQVLTGIRGHGLVFTLASGRLPAGLELDLDTGWIYGNPAEPGTFPITIDATGAAGSVIQAYTLKVESSLLPNQRQGSGAVYTIGSGTEMPSAGAFAGLTANGSIYAWGISSIGGSGAPTGTGYTQITANNNAYAALKSDGSITAWGDSRYGGVGAPTGSGYTKIYSTNQAFAALKTDGSIVSWGNTIQGGSGAPTASGYKQVSAAVFSFAAVKADGSITVWGDSTYLSGNTPTGVGYVSVVPNANAYAALKADGSITAWGLTSGGGSGAPTGTGFTKIFASQNAYAALRNDGGIAVWGDSSRGGASGPSGTGFVDLWSTANGFAALKTDGSLSSWGASGTFNTATPTGTGYTQVFSTGGSFAALKADGSIVAWGATDSGGTGAPTGTGYTTIYSNNNAFVALKANGSLTAWGNSSFGASGAPTGNGYTQVFSRKYAFAAMKADGTVSVWGPAAFGGAGSSGQVAFGSLQNATAVVPAREYALTGNLPAARTNTLLDTQAAGRNGVAGFQVGANAGLGLGSAVTAGSLPTGVTLNTATGFLQGTPTASGTSNFTVTTYNGTGQASQAYSLTVLNASSTTAAPLFDATKAIGYANYAVGQAASYNLSAVATPSTAANQVNYAHIAGALPPGMTLQTTGTLVGTPSTPGNYSFTLAASDGKGVASQTFTIKVSAATPNQGVGQYSTIDAQSSGGQGLNESAFAALRPDGSIVTWGDSTYGGAGATGVPTDTGYVQIAQTARAFAGLRYDGAIRSWGNSDYGGVGAPTELGYTRLFSNGSAFVALRTDGSLTAWGGGAAGGTGAPAGTGFTQIFSNAQAFVAIKADGSLTGWGNPATGAGGVPSGTGYVTLTANATAFAALKVDGSIVAWGDTTNGGLLPALPTNNSYTALYSNATGFAAVRADGTLATWGATATGYKPFPGGNNFLSVSATGSAFAGLKSDGTIAVWGDTGRGGSNAPTGTGFTAIYSNQGAFAGLRTDGSIVSWGNTGSGSTGAPIGTGYTQIYANTSAFTALKSDGTVKSWGNANFGGFGKAPTTTGFIQVFSTPSAFVGQKTNGSLVAWGASAAGASGAPTGTGLTVSSARAMIPYQQPTTTGELPTAYLGTPVGVEGGSGPNGYQVGAIGQGNYYQVTAGALPEGLSLNAVTGYISGTPAGLAGTYTFTLTTTSPVGAVSQAYTLEVKDPSSGLLPNQRVGSAPGAGGIFPNSGAFATLTANGSIVTWGAASSGGTGAPTGTGFTQLFSNSHAFVALKADGSLSAWGAGSSGGTGAPTTTGFTQVFASASAFVALQADGSLSAWGAGSSGGSGAPAGTGYVQVYANASAFAALTADGAIAAWGAASSGGTGAPTGTGFSRVYATGSAFAALQADGSVTAWGNTGAGGTGAPTAPGYTQVFSNGTAFAALHTDGSLAAWGQSTQGGGGAPTGTGYSQVFATQTAFAALKASGAVTAWGDSGAGGSGAPTGTGYTQVFASNGAFVARKADGSLTAWGNSARGGSGAPAATVTGYTQVFSNSGAFAALKADGSISAWGDTAQGGGGAPSGTGFIQVFANTAAFVARKADGTLTAWGATGSGGTGAPAGAGFVTVQSALSADPAFAGFPVNSALTTSPSQPFFAHLGAQGVGARYEIAVGALPPGLTLDATTGAVSGTATQAGTYFFTLAASTPLGTGTQSFTLQVPQATQLVTAWPIAAAITYGQTLAASALTGGTAAVPGTFAFTSPSTVPNAGPATQGVTFTPTNPASGPVESSPVSVTVNKAPLTVTADPQSRAFGAANPSFTATITGFVNGETSSVVSGTPVLTTTATAASPAGSYPITAALGTLAASNYTFGFVAGSLAVGLTVPTLTSVAIASNNPNPIWAKPGDAVTVTFTASEAIALPTATLAGRPATVALVASNTYTATATLAAGDTEGTVAFSLVVVALTGAVGGAVTATTDSSAVTFDDTEPTLSAVALASNNAVPADAKPGDTVTVTFTAGEPITAPAATIAGRTALVTNTSGNTYTAAVTMAVGDVAGPVAFSLTFSDRAGNAGTAVVATTNSSAVNFEDPAPVVLATGVVTTLAGAPANTAGSADGTGTAASFGSPAGAAVDAEGTVYVADSVNHKIRKISSTGVVTTLAGSGSAGSADATGAAASFSSPAGVAVGSDGTVYVADAGNHTIRKITAAGVVTTLAGSGAAGSADAAGAAASFSAPSGVAVGSDGTVYVADAGNHTIRQITAAGVVTTLAGAGSAGRTDASGVAASFSSPSGITVGTDGTVYVADYGNHKIRKITAAGVVTTLAGSGVAGSLDGTGTAATFNGPYGVALGADGALQVAERTGHKIRTVTSAGLVATLAGSGTAGSADGTGTAASFNAPFAVAVGGDGTVYVADRSNNKIRKITVGELTNTVLTAAVPTVTSGATIALTATVTLQSGAAGTVTPTGSVIFKLGPTTLGTATLNASGVATLNVDSATLAGGVSSVFALYPGRSGGALPVVVASTSAALALTVNRAPTLPGAVASTTMLAGTAGSFQFAATGYPAPTFSSASPLPAGVTLASGGLLAGTPAAGSGGTYPVTISVSNGIGAPLTHSFTLVVTSAPVFSGSAALNTVAFSRIAGQWSAVGYPLETNPSLFAQDFSAGALPTGWTVSGAAALNGGGLELTPAVNNSRGILTLPAVGAASPTGFAARFNLIVGNTSGADGLSFNYGALLTGPALAAVTELENGLVSAGLVITFGEYNDDRVEVRYNNQILSAVYVPLPGAAAAAVDVTVTPLGLLTLTVDGTTLTTVNLGADYVAAAKAGWQFAFAARTGALNSRHAIDDLAINALQLAYGTTANYLESTFGAALPAGWTLFGDAVLDPASRELVLTPNAASKNGALVLPALGAASPDAFSAQFDYRAADGSGADGISFNYGLIPASPVGADGGIATSGLVIQMTEFGTDRILIKYDGATLATGNVTLEGPYRRVSVDVAADLSVAVSVNGVVAVTASLPAGYASAAKTAWQFAFGGKTGASTNQHSLRNLSIARPRSLPAGLTLNPVTGVLSGTLSNPAAADYAVTAVATNAFGATLRDVTIANRPLAALSPTFAAATDIGIVRNAFSETGVTLGTITLGFAPRPGQQLTLVQNTGGAASSGRFAGLAEGATVTAVYNGDTFTFTLSYVGGSGNDVTLTRVLGAGQVAGVATVTTLAGSPANAAGSADATGVAASFSAPYGVAVGTDGTVTVADSANHKIRQISPTGVVTTLAGAGTAGSADGTGAAASFTSPYGVAVGTDGTVTVADTGNHKIRQISPAGVVTTLAGGIAGSADGTGAAAGFTSPYGVAVGTDGTVYVADSANRKIRQISPAGVVTTLAGSGTAGSADGTGAAASFNRPTGIAVGADGTVYVADTTDRKIRQISPAGVVTTLAGAGTAGSADGTGAAALFSAPFSVAVGTDGTVYVADSANHTIRRITAAGVVTTLAGAGTAGSADGTGAAASFSAPFGVAVGLDGTVYVGDRGNHKVRKITSADARPLLTSTAVTAIAATGATINGTVNPNGFLTAAQVEYGLTSALGSTAPITLAPTNGTAAQTVAVTLAGLTTGLTYSYRLTATNVDGTAVTTAGTFIPLAPVKPTLLTLSSTSVTPTTATWGGDVTADGGAVITERGIKYRVAGSTGAYTALTASGTTGAFTVSVTGLSGGTTYQFYAYAVNSVGEGRTSEEKSVTTPAATTVSAAPTALSATVGGTSAELAFTPGYNGGAAISNYEVSFNNGSTWVAMTPATATPPLTLTGLTPGVAYQVKVRAINAVGAGDASAAVVVTAPVTLAVTSAASAGGTFGTPFSYQITGNGGPTSFGATGLPSGLSLNPGTGAITGTPTQTGTFVADLTIATTAGSAQRALEIVIAKKALTVTAEAKSRGYGQADPAFTAILSGFVGSDTAAVVTGAPQLTVAATAASPVGTYAITPAAGSLTATNYRFGTFVPANLTVTAQPATVVLGDLAQTYTGAPRPVQATTAPASLAVSLSYEGTGATTYPASATAPTAAGSYTVTATITAANYSGTTTQTLVVAQASQTITIAPLPTSVALNTLSTVNIAATASSGLPVTFRLDTGSAAGVGLSGATSPASLTSLNGRSGTVQLIATQAGNPNYAAAPAATANFEVTKVNQKITFAAPADQTFAPARTVALAATTDAADPSLTVSFTVVSGPATVSGSTLTLTGTGLVVVRASQAGDTTYNAAPSVDQSFAVGRSVQTVNFAALSNATYGDPAITLAATTTPAGRPVTYERISGPATLVGTTLTLTGAGEVTVRASVAGDADYEAATPVTRTFTVAAKALTVSGAVAQNKTYDGTAAAAVTGATLVGVVTGDTVSLGSTGEGTFAQAGAGNSLVVTTAMTLVGAAAANYTLTQPSGLNATITPKALNVGGVTVADKVYDGLLTASANTSAATFVGLVGSDTVSLNPAAAAASFADKAAGAGKLVTVSGLALAPGGAAANYTLVQPTATAQILRKTLTVTGATAGSRDYNGTRTAAVNYAAATLVGKITGDPVDLNTAGATAAFDDRSVGVARPVQVAGLTLTGAASANYNLGQPTLSASITPKALTVTGVTALNKAFDKLTNATVVTTGAALVGVEPADSAAVQLVSTLVAGEFATAEVGTGKTVAILGLTLSGAEAANYTVVQPVATAAITVAALTVAGIVGADKPYDGTHSARVNTTLAALVGLSAGSGVTLDTSLATAAFTTAAVGASKPVQVAGLALAGPNAANYVLTQPTTTAAITPAVLTVSGVTIANKAYDGTRTATAVLAGLQLTGIVAGESVNPVTTGASATFADSVAANGKAVTLAGITLDGTHAANYTLSLPTLSANITRKLLTVSGITVANRVYDGTTLVAPSFAGATLGDVVAGEIVTLDTAGAVAALADAQAGVNKPVTFSGLGLSGPAAANYSLTQPTSTVTITPKLLTVTGVVAAGKTYDGTTTAVANFANAALDGLLPGDAGAVAPVSSSATAAFTSKNAGASQTVAITGLTLGGAKAANYTVTQPETTAEIAPKDLTTTGITAANRGYDATTSATLTTTAAALVGVIVTDAVTLVTTGAVGEFADGDAGPNKPVQVLGLALAGPDAANYTVTPPPATAGITAKSLTVVQITAENRPYDGTTVATLDTDLATLEGVITDDVVTLERTGATGAFASKTVGVGKPVQVSGLTLAGPQAANYLLTQPTATADITAKSLTVTGVTADAKVYDGTLTATPNFTGLALVGIVSGDTVTPVTTGATASFATKAVATGKTVTLAGLTLAGGDAANYTVTQPTTTATITAKSLTVTGLTAANKVYDRTLTATPNFSGLALVGIVSGDTVTPVTTGATASFATKTVETGKTVTLAGLTLGGGDAANYAVTQPTTTADITAKTLTVTGVTAASKVYDRTLTATPNFTGLALVGIVSGDTVTPVTAGATASFATKTAETGKTVTLAGLTLGGGDAANYAVTQPTTTADITAKTLTVTGVTAANKVYDRTLTATPNFTGLALVGIISGDTVNPVTAGATASFATKTVETGKTVTLAGLTLGGGDAANYAVTQPTTTADITAKTLTVTGVTVANRVYDRTLIATPNFTGLALVGIISGDTVTPDSTGATASFATKTAETGKTVTLAGLTLGGGDAANYVVTQPTTTADITAKSLTVTGVTAANKVYDRTLTAVPNFTGLALVGIISGDTVNPVTAGATASFATKTAETGKTVTLAGLTLSGGDAGNYTVTQPTTTADITAKTLTVTGVTAANKVYDRTLTAAPNFAGLALVGIISGDAVNPVTAGATASFATKTAETGKTVTLAGLTLSGGDAGNYSVTQPTTTADITARNLTVSGATAASKIYDKTRTATLSFGTASLVGIISPDLVTLLSGGAAGTFADANAGLNKGVTITGLTLGGTDSVNYSLTPPTATADIAPAEVSIAITNLTHAYDGQPKAATVTVTPVVPTITVYSDLRAGAAPTNAGSYFITVNVTDPNYSGSAGATLVIAKAAQTVTLNAPTSAMLATPVAVSATASSKLPVTLAVTGPATLAGGQLLFTAPGTATVTATQPGNDNYAAATATATITSVGKLAQTIAFAALADRVSNSREFTLNATASSGLPVSFTVVSGPALLSGATLALTGVAGRVQIRASQAGDATYGPAPDVVVSFTVTAATTSVYFGTVTSAGSTAKAGDVAAALPPNSNKGSLLVVAPSVGVNSAFDFTLNADGTFTITYVVPAEPSATPRGTPAIAAAPVTLTIRGSLVNGRLEGVIEPIGLAFSAAVLPVTGASANAAGFYQSSNLATAGGATYSVVGTNNQVLVLATTPEVTTGGLTTLGSNGSFNLQTQTSAGLATIRGSVDTPTTSVSGTISVPGKVDTNFAGVASTTTRTDRLINLSSRVQVGAGRTLITGFVLGGPTPKRVLLRAVGPTLAGFGVTGALANPRLQLFDASGQVIAENDDWSGAETAAAMAQVGAFGLAAGAKDAALLVTLAPGAYTMQVSEVAGAGVVLAEIYDASLNPNADYQRLVNISTRGEAGIGENVLIGGFIITGNSPKKVLVRGIGPGLAAFGLAGTLADPRLRVYRGGELVGENDNWSAVPAEATAAAQAARDTGAFALASGSKDAALILTLMPGAYTGQVSSADGTSTGTALVEIYELP